jgi:hypothetical protein
MGFLLDCKYTKKGLNFLIYIKKKNLKNEK